MYNPENSFYNTDEIICGLDPSLNHTGIVILNSKGDIIHQECIDIEILDKKRKVLWKEKNKKLLKERKISVKNDFKPTRGMARLNYIREKVLKIIKKYKVTKLAIEGYSFRSSGRSVFDLGELGGVLRLALYNNNLEDYLEVPPTSLKSFIIIGNADKELMRQGILDKYEIDFENDNIADAYALARFILCFGKDSKTFCQKGATKLIKKIKEDHEVR